MPTIYVLSKNKKNVKIFPRKIFIFYNFKNLCISHGQVFVIFCQVGDGEPQEEVLMMCDDPTNQHFYKVRDYTELMELKDRLLASLCDGK